MNRPQVHANMRCCCGQQPEFYVLLGQAAREAAVARSLGGTHFSTISLFFELGDASTFILSSLGVCVLMGSEHSGAGL